MFMHLAQASEGPQKSRTMFWLAAIALLAAALSGCGTTGAANKSDTPGGGGGKGGGRRGMGGDVPVTVAKASQRDVPVEVQVIGNVEAYSTIAVKAQVTGQLIRVYF